MKMKKILALAGITAMLSAGAVSLGAMSASAAGGGDQSNTNGEAYWEAKYDADCFKYDANQDSPYGSVTEDNKAVKLNPGGWIALIVNGGSNDNEVANPESGHAYQTPTNKGEQAPNVSHWIVCGDPTPPVEETPPADDCELIYDFAAQKMWEVTWGYGFEDRNGGAPKFTMQSNGGLVAVDGKPVPSYMTDYKDGVSWHWLYVTDGKDNNHTYQFADGTKRSVTVDFPDGCSYPIIVWDETPPLEIVPVKPTWVDECGPDNGHWIFEDTDQYAYTEKANKNGSVTITVAPKLGYFFAEGTKAHWTKNDSGEVCATTPPVTTPPSTSTPTPSATIPAPTETFTPMPTPTSTTTTPAVVPTTSSVPPTVAPRPVPSAPELAYTGSNAALYGGFAGLLLILGSGLVLVARKNRD